MNDRAHRCSWWQLWLLFPVLGILALVEVRTSLSPAGHMAVEVGAVLALLGLVAAWVRANRLAMLREACGQMVWREVGGTTATPVESRPVAESDGFKPKLEPATPANLQKIDPAWGTRKG